MSAPGSNRVKNRTKLAVFLFGLCSAMPIAHADDGVSALEDALDLCLQLPSDQGAITTRLEDGGWKKTPEDDDGATAFHILYSTIFTSRHRPDDMDYTYRNSAFMAASILGNSALQPGQPTFTHGELKLGVFGVREGTGYCALTGPKWAASVIEDRLGITLGQTLPYLRSYEHEAGSHTIGVGEIDIEALHRVDTDLPEEQLGKYREFDRIALGETSLTITPQTGETK